MRRAARACVLFFILSIMVLLCRGGERAKADPQAGAPPAPNVSSNADPALFTVDHPEQFPLATATAHPATSELVVTGAVTPDISRNVPVVSLASGRVTII